ncbi:unnamed protein product [Prunus brigantina]
MTELDTVTRLSEFFWDLHTQFTKPYVQPFASKKGSEGFVVFDFYAEKVVSNLLVTAAVAGFVTTGQLVDDVVRQQGPSKLPLLERFVSFDDCVQNDVKLWPFKVIEGPANKPMISVTHQGQEKQFAAEEISSMILAKMREKNSELSTKVMRYFSSAVFKTNAVKLAQTISEAATCDQAIEIQKGFVYVKASLDSVVKIFLGIELDTMRGTNEEGTRFSNAFDEANANTLYRYVDISWKIRRFLTLVQMQC